MTLDSLVNVYLDGIGLIQDAVSGMTREQVLARPVPDKWSTLELVCHLADFDAIDADRMKRTIAEDRPVLFDSDEKLFASRLAYQDRDMDEELALISSTRRQMARI